MNPDDEVRRLVLEELKPRGPLHEASVYIDPNRQFFRIICEECKPPLSWNSVGLIGPKYWLVDLERQMYRSCDYFFWRVWSGQCKHCGTVWYRIQRG
jgi:hypothetical protein